MKKYILHIVFIFVCLIQAKLTVANISVVENQFQKTVIRYYQKTLQKIHQNNIHFLKAGYKDSVNTDIEIDLSYWKYNVTNQKWEYNLPQPAGEGDPSIAYSKYKFYYHQNIITNETTIEVNHPQTTAMGDLFQGNSTKPTPEWVLMYHVHLINLPLLIVDAPNILQDPDTTTSIFQTLKDLEYTSDEMWEKMLAMNNRLGEFVAQGLSQTPGLNETYVLLFKTSSESVWFNNKARRFSFYTFYENLGVDDKLKSSLKMALNSFQYNSGFKSHDIINSFTAIIKCQRFDDCSDLAAGFKTPEAIEFWTEFTEKAPLQSENFFGEHKDVAIQIANAIDGLTDRDRAAKLRDQGMCYIADAFCPEGLYANNSNVLKAGGTLLTHLLFNSQFELVNKAEVIAQLKNESTSNIRFHLKTEDEGTVSEFEFEFDQTQSREFMVTALLDLGLSIREHYGVYLLNAGIEDSWYNYGNWLDHFYLKSPPAAVLILANIATGPVNAIYGFATGTDMLTGEELSGWDYVFNAFDVIGAGVVMGEIGQGFFKSFKVFKNGKVLDIATNSRVYKAYHSAVKTVQYANTALKNAVYKCMAWGVDAVYKVGDKSLELLNITGQELGIIRSNRIDLNGQYALVTTGGQAFPLNGVDVYIDGQKTTQKMEMVKDGDNVGFRVVNSSKIIPTTVEEIKHLLVTENGESFFWSGKTNGIGGEVKALEIAKSRGGTTLEGLLKDKNIELPTWDPNNPTVMKLWEDVSAEYAKQVSGEVRAVIGASLRPGNIWQTKELPALMSNLNVTKIITIDPETLVENVIFTR